MTDTPQNAKDWQDNKETPGLVLDGRKPEDVATFVENAFNTPGDAPSTKKIEPLSEEAKQSWKNNRRLMG